MKIALLVSGEVGAIAYGLLNLDWVAGNLLILISTAPRAGLRARNKLVMLEQMAGKARNEGV